MHKFTLEITQTGYRTGVVEVEAPDIDAALRLIAINKRYDDPSIVYSDDWRPSLVEYVEPEAIWVVE